MRLLDRAEHDTDDALADGLLDQADPPPAATPAKKAAKPKRRRRFWLVTALAVLVLAVAGAAVWWFYLRQPEQQMEARTITSTATVGEVTRTVDVSGTLEPADSETLSFAVSGTVTEVLVTLGDQVTEGQVLARVDTELLESELEAAESTLSAAEDDLASAEDGDSSAQLSAAQAQLATAQDAVDAAETALTNATLTAPFAGQVISLDLAVGDVVGSGSFSSGGAPGAAGGTTTTSTSGSIGLASTTKFILDSTVSSTDLASVKAGLQAEITATGLADMLYGTVTEVGRVASTTSSGSAAFPVTISLTGDAEGVYGGTSASASIIVEKRTDVLTVATQAISSEGGSTYVTVVAADGTTSQRDVTVGETYGTTTEILDGLTEGETAQVASFGGGNRTQQQGEMQMPSGMESMGAFPGGDMGGAMPGDGTFPGGDQ